MPAFRAPGGNIVFPGFPAPELEWLRRNKPDIFAGMARVLLPAAFLNLYLTGEAVGGIPDAAGTVWLNVGARTWSQTLLDLGHVTQEQMLRLVEGCAPSILCCGAALFDMHPETLPLEVTGHWSHPGGAG